LTIVKAGFKKDFFPKQVECRLEAEYPEHGDVLVFPETMYRYLYGETGRDGKMTGHFLHPRRKWKRLQTQFKNKAY
jgi:IS30 family transposase